MKSLNVTSVIEHKHAGLPRFVCVPMAKVDPWKPEGTTTVDVTINGVDISRRSLKRWDDRRCWFMDLAEAACCKANVETGDHVQLSLRIASEELPTELTRLIEINPKARASWERLTLAQQRMLREEVIGANQPRAHAARPVGSA